MNFNKKAYVFCIITMFLITIAGASAADSQSVYYNAGDYYSGSNRTSFTGSIVNDGVYSIGIRFKLDSGALASSNGIFSPTSTSTSKWYSNSYINNIDKLNFFTHDSDGGVVSTNAVSEEVWYSVVMVANNTEKYLFSNNAVFGNTSYSSANTANYANPRYLGYSTVTTTYFNGYIYDYTEWDDNLDRNEISNWFNCGETTGCGTPENPSLQVKAFDYWDNSSINDFNVTLSSTTYGTTNGTLIISNLSIGTYYYNVTYLTNYFNVTQDVSTNLAANDTTYTEMVYPYASDIKFRAYELITGNEISANFTLDSTTKTENESFYLSTGSYTVTTNSASYYEKNKSFNVSSLDNKTVSVTGLYDAKYFVSPRDVLNNNTISEANITISNATIAYTITVNNVTNSTFNITSGDYTLTITATNRTIYEENISISSGETTKYAYMYAYNSLWVYAYRQSDNVAIQNFNVTVSNATTQYTANGSAGVARLSLIPSGNYDVAISATGYVSANYVVVMTDNSFQTLNAYLSASTDTFIFTVKDKNTNGLIEGISITQKRFINSTLTTIASKTTDITGRTQFTYENGIEYTFIASGTGYESKTFTLEVLFNEYTLLLDPTIVVNETIFIDDVFILKKDYNFVNGSSWVAYEFNSQLGSLEYYNVTTILPNGTTTTTSGSSALGSTINNSIDATSALFGDVATVVLTYKSSLNNDEKVITHTYPFIDYAIGSGAAPHFKEATAGMSNLQKVFWSSIIIIFLIGIFGTVGIFLGDSLLLGSIGGIIGLTLVGLGGFINGVVVGIGIFIMTIFIVGRLVNRG